MYITAEVLRVDTLVIITHVRKVAESNYQLRRVHLSVRPHETRIPLDGFS